MYSTCFFFSRMYIDLFPSNFCQCFGSSTMSPPCHALKVRGGKLKARKGVNVPTVQIDCAALTEKDIEVR